MKTYSHGESTTKVIEDDPGTWVPTVVHGHDVLWREAVEKMCSRSGEALGLVEDSVWPAGGKESRRRRAAQKVECVDVVESLTVDGKVDGKSAKSRRACG